MNSAFFSGLIKITTEAVETGMKNLAADKLYAYL
jgi:hypothetical protein